MYVFVVCFADDDALELGIASFALDFLDFCKFFLDFESVVDFGLADAWASPSAPAFLLLGLSGQLGDIIVCLLGLEITVVIQHYLILREYLFVLHDGFLEVQLHSVRLILFFEPVHVDAFGQSLRVLVAVDELLQVLFDEVALRKAGLLGVVCCFSELLAG